MSRQRIFIRNFENPESFSFTQYDPHVAKVEEQLNRRSATKPLYQVSLNNIVDGDIIAIYYKPWQKYILSKIVVNTGSLNSYRAWLINYGFHVKLRNNNLVYKVSEDDNIYPYSTCIHKGGILHISSGSADQWGTEICEETYNFIKNAAKIYFIKLYTNTDGHQWGELKVIMRNGKESDVANYLIENCHAVRTYERQTIKSLESELGSTQLEQTSDCLPANECFIFSAWPEFQKEIPCTHTGVVRYPAGFDIARLHKYKDQNHWHIRKSTRMIEKKPDVIKNASFDECKKVEPLNNTSNTVSLNASSGCQPEYVPLHSTWEHMPPKPEPFDFDMPEPCVARGVLNANLEKNNVSVQTATLMHSDVLVGKGRGSLITALANLGKNLNVSQATHTVRSPCLFSKQKEEKLINDTKGCAINKPLRQDLTNRMVQLAESVNDAHNGLQLKSNIFGALVIAHSAIPLSQCLSLDTAGFTITVYDAMRSMHFDQLYCIQSYAWPHIFCRNSLVVINGPTSGKSWCYLPTICDLLIQCIPERQIQQQHGPSAIMLVATQGHIKQTALTCQRLLKQFNRIKWKTVVTYSDQRDSNQILTNLINGCGILITTPRLFLSLVEEHKKLDCLFNIDVLNHIVIDDFDQMLAYSKECCLKLIAKIFQLFGSGDKLNVPLIITSRQWISGLMPRIIQLMHKPLLLIADFVEAAAYGKINMFVKVCKQNEKIPLVVNQLAMMNALHRIVVIVGNSNDEISDLNEAFRTRNILTYDYTQNGTNRDPCVQLPSRRESLRQQIVVVCTDEELTKIKITYAHIIIHLSMANNWNQFTRRFSLISDSIPNYVAMNFDSDKTKIYASLQTIIYVDKHNHTHNTPYLIEFLRRHNRNLSQATENSINELHRQHEEESITRKEMPLCTYLLDGSSCSNAFCEQRHQLTQSDFAMKEQSAITCNGDICIQVLQVYTPTHVSAQLLKHKPINGEWKTFFNLNAKLSMGLDIYYSDPKNRVNHWPQKVNDICVIKMENHYARVRLVKETQCQNDHVIAKMLDRGSQLLQLESSELLVCVDKFRKEPATATDIRLTELVANNDEQQWCEKAIEATKIWLQHKAKNSYVIHAQIDCMLKETIFVKNIIVVEHLPTISTYVYKMDLKSSLTKQGFAIEKFGICEIKQLIKLQLQQQTHEDVEKIAFSENVNSKNYEQEQHSEGFDNNEFGLKSNIVNCCLENESKARWTTLPLRKLTKVEIGDEQYNGKWNHLYLQRIEPEDLEAFDKLCILISKHITELKGNPQPLDEHYLKVNQDCIVKYDNQYLRARVCDISRTANGNCYRFFLVDFACFTKALSHQLVDDFLYKTNSEIIHFTAFQAVHCTMAGIQLLGSTTKAYKISGILYAYMVAEHNTDLFNGCKSYDIVLFECVSPDNLKDGCIVNVKLVDLQVANYASSDRQHFYDSIVGIRKELNFDKFTEMLKSYQDLDDQAAVEVGYTFFGDILDTLIMPWKIVTEKSSINAETKKVLSRTETKEQLLDAVIMPSSQPQLIVNYKYPKITWHDSAAYVQLQIHAGDNTNYEISWQADVLFYATETRKEACSLQLRGLIDTTHVTHELRGLSVIVKMKKQICGKWPRLLKKSTKQTPLVKYNIDRYLAEQTGLREAQQKLRLLCGTEAYNFVDWYHTSEYSDSESDELDDDFTELNMYDNDN